MYINWTRHVLLGMVPYRCRAWPEVFIKASVPHGKKVRLSVKQIITLFFAFRRLPRLTEVQTKNLSAYEKILTLMSPYAGRVMPKTWYQPHGYPGKTLITSNTINT